MKARTLIQELTKKDLMRWVGQHPVWIAITCHTYGRNVYVERDRESLTPHLADEYEKEFEGPPPRLCDIEDRLTGVGITTTVQRVELEQPMGKDLWIAYMRTTYPERWIEASVDKADLLEKVARARREHPDLKSDMWQLYLGWHS